MAFEEEELRSSEITPQRLQELATAFPSRVATHRKTPPDLLATLATSADDDTRWHVARRRQTPEAALTALTRDPVVRVRVAAYENEVLPDAVRATALGDPAPEVRASLASMLGDGQVLGTLAADPSPLVRAAVAANPECPVALLSTLAHDPHEDVRIAFANAAHAPPELLEALVRDGSDTVAGLVAGREVSDLSLRTLAGHGAGEVREAVAGNAATPTDVLAMLAKDPAETVRTAVVWHPAATDPILDGLAHDPAENVREAVARRAGGSARAIERLLTDPAPRVRVVVAADPRLDEVALLILARDGDDRVRARVREHPSATAAVRAVVDAEDKTRKQYVEEPPDAEPTAAVTVVDLVPGSRSAIGGAAWLPAAQAWPTCRQCGRALTLFLRLRLDGIPCWVAPGSQLSVFACRTHDDVPSFATVQPDRPLPRDAWARTDGHVHLRLDRPDVPLVEVPAPGGGLSPATLLLAPGAETLAEVGPLRARFFMGSAGFKVGGVPAWVQGRESYRCFCGARMRLLLQLPEDQRFAVEGAERHVPLFLGNALFVFGCEAQCDPLAVWPIVQS